MRAWVERNRGYLATFIATLGAVGLLQWWSARPPGVEIVLVEPTVAPTETPVPTVTPAPTATAAPVAVFVSGEVRAPDVYYLSPGSRVVEAIEAAGGFTAEADPTIVNLAEPVSDGMHVHVPAAGTVPTPPPLSVAATAVPTAAPPASDGQQDDQAAQQAALININTATPEELDELPGIGPAIAQRIVDYRTANGPFATIEEIKLVSGIGDKLFEKIKALITV